MLFLRLKVWDLSFIFFLVKCSVYCFFVFGISRYVFSGFVVSFQVCGGLVFLCVVFRF